MLREMDSFSDCDLGREMRLSSTDNDLYREIDSCLPISTVVRDGDSCSWGFTDWAYQFL